VLLLCWPSAASNTLKLDKAYPKPTLSPDDALIKVHRAGICATVSLEKFAAAAAAATGAANAPAAMAILPMAAMAWTYGHCCSGA
jgi:threonine dehydrogenase-like Zn-dependent dehydrogenase